MNDKSEPYFVGSSVLGDLSVMSKEKYNLAAPRVESVEPTHPKVNVSSFKTPEGGYSNPVQTTQEANTDAEHLEIRHTLPKVSAFPANDSVFYNPRNSEIIITEPIHSNIRLKCNKRSHISESEKPPCDCRVPPTRFIAPHEDERRNCCSCCASIQTKWKSSSKAKRRAVKISIASLVFVLAVILGFVIYAQQNPRWLMFGRNETVVCDTPECIVAASEIMTSMDPSVPPCSDFYKFSCGGWQGKHPNPPTIKRWTTFAVLFEQTLYKIKHIMETPPKEMESRPFRNARKFYKACVNQTMWNKVGVGPILFTLHQFGGLPAISDNWDGHDFDWLRIMANLRKAFGISYFISVVIGQDDKDSSRKAVYLSQGRLLANPKAMARNETSIRNNELKWMRRVMKILMQAKDAQNTNSGGTSPTVVSTQEPIIQPSTNPPTIQIPTEQPSTEPEYPVTPLITENKTTTYETVSNLSTTTTNTSSIIPNPTTLASNYNLSESVSSTPTQLNPETNIETLHTININFKGTHKESTKDSAQGKIVDFTLSDRDKSVPKDETQSSQKIKFISQAEKQGSSASEPQYSIDDDTNDVWNFYVEIAKIMEPDPYLQSGDDKYNRMTIKKLMQISPQVEGNINWLHFFTIIFEGTYTEINENFEIVVEQLTFFQKLPHIIKKTPKRILANAILYFLLIEMGSEVSPTLRNFHERKLRREDYSTYIGRHVVRPWFDCANKVRTYMEYIVTNLYVRENYDVYLQDIETVEGLVSEMRRTLVESLKSSPWMDAPTRGEAVKKTERMRRLVGFSKGDVEGAMVQALYMHYPEMSEFDHYGNMLRVTKYYSEMSLYYLSEAPPSRDSWSVHNLEVNAVYSLVKNSIQIPTGILQSPFYRRNTILPLVYGSIGAIIGHEMIHGFDVRGMTRSWNGTLHTWWSPQSLTEYAANTRCFETQYSKLPLRGGHTDKEGNSVKVDGLRTKSENIADNEGLSLAWRVYRELKGGREDKLHGLETFSSDQLFFISSAQMWCSNYEEAELVNALKYGVHTPGPYRVHGLVRNNADFARVFGCSPDSQMVASDKCSLWTHVVGGGEE